MTDNNDVKEALVDVDNVSKKKRLTLPKTKNKTNIDNIIENAMDKKMKRNDIKNEPKNNAKKSKEKVDFKNIDKAETRQPLEKTDNILIAQKKNDNALTMQKENNSDNELNNSKEIDDVVTMPLKNNIEENNTFHPNKPKQNFNQQNRENFKRNFYKNNNDKARTRQPNNNNFKQNFNNQNEIDNVRTIPYQDNIAENTTFHQKIMEQQTPHQHPDNLLNENTTPTPESLQENQSPQPEPIPLPPPETIEFNDVKKTKIEDLVLLAEKYKVQDISELNRQNMVYSILRNFSYINPANVIIGEGVLETLPDGYGFLRSQFSNYVSGPDDIYVASYQIKKFGLRTGDTIKGRIKAPKKGEKYFSLLELMNVNNNDMSHLRTRIKFEDLTPLYPNNKLNLENEVAFLQNGDDSSRIIDLITPMGKGQRALIVAPPKTGKTMLLQSIAHAITKSHPDAYLIVLLIDERPEEVTDMSRTVHGEVVSSTFDEPASRHTQLAEIVIEKAKRLVEYKKDVIILLDSITRLARAYNNVLPSSGKVLTGGVDANSLQKPKRFFGAARNIEEGGSLTIIATALVETGSKMDEVIFEEFKGTGNSEILLDRKISDKRIFPAVDITKSSTRKDDLLVSKEILNKTWMLRKIVSNMSPIEAIEFLKDKMKATKNNAEFFKNMNG